MAQPSDPAGTPADPAFRAARARIAANSRHANQPDQLDQDRRWLKAEAAERYVKELVDGLPPLTDQQRRRLAALLHPGVDDAGPAS